MKKIATAILGAKDGSGKLVYFAWTSGKDGDGLGFDFVILDVFSNLNDSVIGHGVDGLRLDLVILEIFSSLMTL